MSTVSILLGIAAVQLLAAASPGPNFIIVSSYSVAQSRRRGLLVVGGILAADLLWSVLAACGLGVLIAQLPAFHTVLRLASAAYLIWLGARMVIGALRHAGAERPDLVVKPGAAGQAVRAGFVTCMTNPKSIAYYTSLFVLMIPVDAPGWLYVAAVVTAVLVTGAWWISVALFFGAAPVRRAYERARRAIDAVLGAMLVGIGLRLAVSDR